MRIVKISKRQVKYIKKRLSEMNESEIIKAYQKNKDSEKDFNIAFSFSCFTWLREKYNEDLDLFRKKLES
jgi:hypothetical protein